MEFMTALEHLLEHKTFKEWKTENEESYLAHGVYFEGGTNPWQIGFYNPSRDTITTFEVAADVENKGEEGVFKEGDTVHALDPSTVKIPFHHVVETMETMISEIKEHAIKRIIILQNIKEGQVWNATYVTQGLKTLNVKIDAQSGRVISQHLQSIMSMAKQVK